MNTVFAMQPPELRARHAILLYGSTYADAYASIHEVEDENGELRIREGVPASVPGLRALMVHLDLARADRPTFNDTRILSRGASWLVWWVKPAPRRVWFNAKKIGVRSEVVPHPGLVFAVTPKGWKIFAVKGKGRPLPGTKLYQAPYFNVWQGGGICAGSARTPEGDERHDPDSWERAFFDSAFTHPNIHEPGALVADTKGPVSFWKEMLDGKHESFPVDRLVATKTTLGGLLDAIGGEL